MYICGSPVRVEIEDYSVAYSQPFVSFLHCMYNMHNTNSMSGVNEHSLHVGHPGGFE